jgi:hypothetical protein
MSVIGMLVGVVRYSSDSASPPMHHPLETHYDSRSCGLSATGLPRLEVTILVNWWVQVHFGQGKA